MKFITWINRISITAFFVLNASFVRGQVDTNQINNATPIEFDFNTGQFKQILPFDEIFSIQYENIPSSASNINARVIVMNNYDYRTFFKRSDTIINEDSFLAHNDIIQLKPLQRGNGFIGNQAIIPVLFPLRPNRKYLFEIEADSLSPLSTNEQADLKNKLDNDGINDIVNITVNAYLKNTDSSYTKLNSVLEDINSKITSVVKGVNKNYTVNIKNASELTNVKNLINNAYSFRDNLILVKENIEIGTFQNKNATLAILQNAIDSLPKIDWSRLDKNKSLITILDTNTILKGYTIDSQKINLRRQMNIISYHFYQAVDQMKMIQAIADSNLEDVIVHNTFVLRPINATYPSDFVKHARLYITLDIGAAYCRAIDRVNAYSGINFYFRPINKNIPLSQYKRWDDFLGVRTSLLLGITVTSVAEDNVRKGLIGDQALIIGAGFRITPFLKINGGGFMYYSYETNPLISKNQYHTTIAPFCSLSFDLDIKPLFGGIGDALFKQ